MALGLSYLPKMTWVQDSNPNNWLWVSTVYLNFFRSLGFCGHQRRRGRNRIYRTLRNVAALKGNASRSDLKHNRGVCLVRGEPLFSETWEKEELWVEEVRVRWEQLKDLLGNSLDVLTHGKVERKVAERCYWLGAYKAEVGFWKCPSMTT